MIRASSALFPFPADIHRNFIELHA
jgi:hypothetical protein